MLSKTKLSYELVTKYDFRVPRYTSYPTVPNWKDDFGPKDYLKELKTASFKEEPLSLYLHLPFCIRRCLFCACNVLVTNRMDRSERYLQYLKSEITQTAGHMESRNDVIQLHLGGGTPTFLPPEQLGDLLAHVEKYFNFLPEAEKSIEIHPSVTSLEHMDVLVDFKFNRISVGVQDFDPNVQEKLNRFQTFEETKTIIDFARNSSFDGVNIDLIYGLPFQTDEGFRNTVNQSLELIPDRIALYSYAHLPNIMRHQNSIPLEVIPSGSNKFDLFLMARDFYLENGYEQIGFDHFALPTDDISVSYSKGTLRRNFMGFTTKAGTDLLAFGYSGISELSTSYAQNAKDMKTYERMVETYGTATIRGMKLSGQDKLRKQIIMDWLCKNKLDFSNIEFLQPSGMELIKDIAKNNFPEFEEIGFVEKLDNGWVATKIGTLFARVIASSFDEYYDTTQHLFSRSI